MENLGKANRNAKEQNKVHCTKRHKRKPLMLQKSLLLSCLFSILQIFIVKTYHIKFNSEGKRSKAVLQLEDIECSALNVLQDLNFLLHNIYLVKLHSIRKRKNVVRLNVQIFLFW